MDIDKLKSEIEKYRDKLTEKRGKVCTFGKWTGRDGLD